MPPELRNNIYELVLEPLRNKIHYINEFVSLSTGNRWYGILANRCVPRRFIEPGLLGAAKIIRTEAAGLLYNDFKIIIGIDEPHKGVQKSRKRRNGLFKTVKHLDHISGPLTLTPGSPVKENFACIHITIISGAWSQFAAMLGLLKFMVRHKILFTVVDPGEIRSNSVKKQLFYRDQAQSFATPSNPIFTIAISRRLNVFRDLVERAIGIAAQGIANGTTDGEIETAFRPLNQVANLQLKQLRNQRS